MQTLTCAVLCSNKMSFQGISAHIVLEGNICAGKSTICSRIQRELGNNAVMQSELTEDKFLSAFYSDMKRFAFSFQMYMLTTRLHQANEGRRLATEGKVVLTDRGILGDWAFARKNWLDGNMDDDQYAIYLDTVSRRALGDLHRKVDLIIYLDVEPSQCCWRMRNLRKTQAEENVLSEYLEGIDNVYFEGMVNMLAGSADGVQGKALVVDWTTFGNEELVLQKAVDLLEGRTTAPVVKFVTVEEAEKQMEARSNAVPEESLENYNSAEQIEKAYASLKAGSPSSCCSSPGSALDMPFVPDSASQKPGTGPVFIRFDICLTDCQKTGTMKPRSNAFKRVVMHYLSSGRSINFYSDDADCRVN